MFERIKKMFLPASEADFDQHLEHVLAHNPVPVFWLFGKTQSGKTSTVKFLTGADEAEIGSGFKSCTQFSREYAFPLATAPLLIFLDTRGLEEPGYDAAEDLRAFHSQAHIIVVTVRLLDHAVDNVVKQLKVIRKQEPDRPVVLLLTCLHEAYPQQQHVEPYPFHATGEFPTSPPYSADMLASIEFQRQRFQGLFDYLIPVDLTPVEEGFADPEYGGALLKATLISALPAAYRQTLMRLEEVTGSLQGLYERRALPYIMGYSSLAASAGAIPLPWVDMLLLPGIQTRMIYHLAGIYGQKLTQKRYMEFAGTVGAGLLLRQGIREFAKLIPFVGIVAGAALAGSATFALGKAFCFYYGSVLKGVVPKANELKHYYQEQLKEAERLWKKGGEEERRKGAGESQETERS